MIVNIEDVNFNITKEPIENIQTDVMVHWTNASFSSGPEEFKRIHREAANDLYKATILFNDKLGEADCLSTHAGMLPAKIAIHVIQPTHIELYKKAFYNVSQTIKKYQEDNLVRTVSLYIPDHIKDNVENIMTYLFMLDVETIIIACREDQYNEVVKIISSYKKIGNIWKVLDRLFSKTMIWVGKFFLKKTKNP